MKLPFFLLPALLLFAADKPDLSGTWRLDGDAQIEGVLSEFTIEQSESDLRISDASADKSSTISCNTVGKECDGTLSGKSVKVSYYFNGPVLVETVFIGKDNDRVVKTRRSLSEDGQKMTVEVIQIVPAGKSPEKLVFVRQKPVAAENSAARL